MTWQKSILSFQHMGSGGELRFIKLEALSYLTSPELLLSTRSCCLFLVDFKHPVLPVYHAKFGVCRPSPTHPPWSNFSKNFHIYEMLFAKHIWFACWLKEFQKLWSEILNYIWSEILVNQQNHAPSRPPRAHYLSSISHTDARTVKSRVPTFVCSSEFEIASG